MALCGEYSTQGDEDDQLVFGLKLSDIHTAIGTQTPIVVPNTSILQGTFAGTKKAHGPAGRYVYVPKGWVKPDDEYLSKIFDALGLYTPNLIFMSYSCPENMFPDLGLSRVDDSNSLNLIPSGASAEQKKLFSTVMKSKLNSAMKTLSNAFVHGGSVYFCNEAHSKNPLVDLILNSLPKEGIAVAISYLADTGRSFTKEMADSIRRNSVPLTDIVKKPVLWSADTPDEKRLATALSNFLIFEDKDDCEYFQSVLENSFPVGLICAAGENILMDKALKTLRQGLPMVIFKYMNGAGHSMSSLIEFQNETVAYQKQLVKLKAAAALSVKDKKQPPPPPPPPAPIGIEERLLPGGQDIYGVTDEHRFQVGTAFMKIFTIFPQLFPRSHLCITFYLSPT